MILQIGVRTWIIPARAGNTLRRISHLFLFRGSSPRVRGTLLAKALGGHLMRIIPARAGNTSAGAVNLSASPDHPRACGEHDQPSSSGQADGGSSPRVRGTLQSKAPALADNRIIPARAGNTSPVQGGCASYADHPRACGEHLPQRGNVRFQPGSSPRVRGTRRLSLRANRERRIIPARAGNTERLNDE